MLNPKDFIHPEDEAAIRNMEAIPGFASALKLMLKYFDERQMRAINTASCIRLSPTQLPKIYNMLPPICKRLSIKEPEFYLEMNPYPNAYAAGDTRTMVVVTSGLIQYMSDDEARSVIAHECGHIACRHMLYHTLAFSIKDKLHEWGLLGDLVKPVVWALFYWSRKSELSADRAAAIALCSVEKVITSEIRLAGGPQEVTGDVNVEEFIKQADDYDEIQSNAWDKYLLLDTLLSMTHPFSAVRVKEIAKWGRTDHYQRLIKGIEMYESAPKCPKCQSIIDPEWEFCKYCGTKLK